VPYVTLVHAVADGIVTRADRQFTELEPELHRYFLDQSEKLESTPLDILERLRGRCVELDHGIRQGFRLRSIYAHLSAVHVTEGAHVFQGDPLGAVGNSGTTAGVRGTHDDAHLHLEIRFQQSGGREMFLGQGITEREIRGLLKEVFVHA
jgi:murein DD-endopeptidase MepM/ murein hydrolase activator NlpD